MMPLPRFSLLLALACSLFLTSATIQSAFAQQRNNDRREVDPELLRDVDNFWHYAKIAHYELALSEAQKILQRADRPVEVLEAFEAGPGRREELGLEHWLLRWQRVEEMRETITQIIGVLNEGQFARRSDPAFIQQNVRRLSQGERAYLLGIARLRESGELAVPIMLDMLRSPNEREHHGAIRRGLRDLGRAALNPLVAATETTDPGILLAVVSVLGEIGYDVSVPYLARVVQNPEAPNGVRDAARQALIRMGAGDPANMDVAQLFYDLGEQFYYNTAAISADPRLPVAFVWFWNEQGLTRREVPPQIFNEIMAMRACEYALSHDEGRGDAVSLWLAANYQREVELPEGEIDRTRLPDQPDAHYYGVFAGTRHLSSALARALNDRNAAVALRIVQSLQQIVGESNLFAAGDAGQPIIDAMRFPDRLVRYYAAFTLAEALPQQSFPEQDRVVPILADAVAQTGRPNVVIILPDQDQFNRIADGLRDEYGVAGGITVEAALADLGRLPAVDVILLTEQLDNGEMERLFRAVEQNPRLEHAPKVFITRTRASPWAMQEIHDPLIHTTQATEPNSIRLALDEARVAGGALPLDEQHATELALEAADLLERLAISRGQVLDVLVAEPTLLWSLDDERPAIAIAAASVLAVIDSPQAQPALLERASDDATDHEVRIAMYRSLASSAKFYGNRLGDEQVQRLQQTVTDEQDLAVRSAAAEAHGALNLPADRAQRLIMEQARR